MVGAGGPLVGVIGEIGLAGWVRARNGREGGAL